MTAPNQPAKELLDRYQQGTCSPEERAMVEAWYATWNEQEPGLSEEQLTAAEERIFSRLPKMPEKARTVSLWPRIAAVAASVLLVLSIGTYVLMHKPATEQTARNQQHDIAPGRNQATLTLANGQQIILTQGLTGKLAQQGSTAIIASAGQAIAYQAKASEKDATVQYNTLSTARGEQSPYPLILPDGTRIWLNAASSVTFPTAFTGKTREITITGEGYASVVHKADQPFLVHVGNQTIQDIGTEFNINAYPDEPATRITLVSGSAKVTLAQNSLILRPGQQAQNTGTNLKMQKVDTEGITAWKNNYFLFDDNNIEGIMRQVSRWYDVNIVYENEAVKAKMLTGTISRYKSVSSVLRKIELTGAAHFRIECKQIKVTQ